MEQQIHPNIFYERAENPAITVYRLTGVNIDVMGHWDRHVMGVLDSWPDSEPCLLLYDLSKSGVSLPYLVFNNFNIDSVVVNANHKGRLERILEQRPLLMIAMALVISSNVSGRIMLSRVPEFPGSKRMLIDTFFTRDSAVEWLRSIPRPGVRQG